MDNLTASERKRFDAKWKNDGDCLTWQGPLDRDGYGSFYLRGATRRAHRVAWFSLHGEVEPGMVINHTCRNRACVNPQHLNKVTTYENTMRDSNSVGYVNSQKTHCKNGHPYDAEVTYKGRTSRICSVCDKARRAEARRRRYHAAKSSLSI